jgi:release factor glutamine methyltransferase
MVDELAGRTAAGTIREALDSAVDALKAAGIETARLEAEMLLAEATGWDRALLAAEPGAGVPPASARTFGEMVRRRLRREPIAYILGRKGFRHIELAVDPRVLIPRPETELLVEVALELRPKTVLDVGTGSGAVALAVADELPDAEVTATDTSPAALELAHGNAVTRGLSQRVSFIEGTIPPGGRFELLLANLPYVSEDEWEGLAPEIREFEPREALVAGPCGTEAIAALLGELRAEPPPDAVALEIGAGQAEEVAGMVREAGYRGVESRRDLAGIERVLLGRRAAA